MTSSCLYFTSIVSVWILTTSFASAFQSNHYNTKEPSLARSTSTSTTQLHVASTKKNLKTFERYLEIECWRHTELRELEPVLKSVAGSCKEINRIVQRAQTDDLFGAAMGADGLPLDDNIQGEVQQQLDVLC